MTSIPAPERTRGGVIYGLYADDDPDRVIRYIGKTSRDIGRRVKCHIYAARGGARTPVAKWIRSHDEQISYIILEECDEYENLNHAERRLIAEYGTLTTQGGLNCTMGGDGSLGWVNGPEAIEKIRAKALGRKMSPESVAKMVAARAGFKHSEETKRLFSEQRKGRKFSPEALERVNVTRARGESNGLSKLTEAQVLEIKARLWDGEGQYPIAAEFGVGPGSISAIATGRTWVQVPWPTDRPRTVRTASQVRAVLSDDTVREIRRLADEEGLGRDRIAKSLNVSTSQVQRILSGERYLHVI